MHLTFSKYHTKRRFFITLRTLCSTYEKTDHSCLTLSDQPARHTAKLQRPVRKKVGGFLMASLSKD
jgi:hypothetical protein